MDLNATIHSRIILILTRSKICRYYHLSVVFDGQRGRVFTLTQIELVFLCLSRSFSSAYWFVTHGHILQLFDRCVFARDPIFVTEDQLWVSEIHWVYSLFYFCSLHALLSRLDLRIDRIDSKRFSPVLVVQYLSESWLSRWVDSQLLVVFLVLLLAISLNWEGTLLDERDWTATFSLWNLNCKSSISKRFCCGIRSTLLIFTILEF